MMKDELFGELNYDYLWEGKVKIKLYGIEYEVELGINGEEEDGISQIQKDTFILYKKNENEIADQIEKAIHNYYKSIYKYEREKNDVNILSKVPDIEECFEMKKILEPIKLCIPELDEYREIDILFDCTWDYDLGMGVRIVNEKVTKIGVQNDVL